MKKNRIISEELSPEEFHPLLKSRAFAMCIDLRNLHYYV